MAAPQNFRTAINGFKREDVVHYLEYLNAKYTTQINQMTADSDAMKQKIAVLEEDLEEKALLADKVQALDSMKVRLEAAENKAEELGAKCELLQQELDSRPALADSAVSQAELDAVSTENEALKNRCRELQQQLSEKSLIPQGANPEELSRLQSLLDSANAENAVLKAQCTDLRQQLSAMPAPTAAPCMADQELEAYRRAERAERIATQRAEQIYQRVNLVLNNATGKVDVVAADLSGAAERFNDQLTQLQSAIAAARLAVNDAVSTMYALRPDQDLSK